MRAASSRWCTCLASRLLVPRSGIQSRQWMRTSALFDRRVKLWPQYVRPFATAVQAVPEDQHTLEAPELESLPWSCPGCGAFTQQHDAEGPGFYSLTRKPVKAFLATQRAEPSVQESDQDETPQSSEAANQPSVTNVPVCDRCHNLLHHHQGHPIVHPTLAAVQAIFDETPYSYNHVYHVIDAADFPLSVIPRLHEWLDVSSRSQNRRAKHAKFHRGRKVEMSFIITRSDLLAPSKEQVDQLMPLMTRILRNALGRAGRDLRLGNVHMVSSHRGWWTKQIKESIWQRGGGGWMVGKVNVGKSNLLQNLLPRGRIRTEDLLKVRSANKAIESTIAGTEQIIHDNELKAPFNRFEASDETSLLPPRPKEVDFPVLPTVSELAGTTASPIRVPFGKGKGELIDLPGLDRGGLEGHILDEYKSGLVMTSRVKAKAVVIRPWQSLVISNFIRITPRYPEVPFLAYPFLPHNVEYHVCHTDKAKEILAQTRNHVLKGIATPETADSIRSAGTYQLPWDITGRRAGPLTAKDAVGLSPERLPFAVYGLDVLIESIGWIEITAQVRKRAMEQAPIDPVSGQSLGLPEIEIFSPNGQHVGHRETLQAWLLGGQRKPSKSQRRAPPRKSMKGAKKAAKLAKREERARERSTAASTVQ